MLISKTGIEPISTSDAYEEARQILVDSFGENIDTSAGTPMDYFCQNLANAFIERDKNVQAILTQVDPRTASDYFLDALGSLTFSSRNEATNTIVKARCRGLPTTKIPKDSKAISNNGDIFLSTADVVINKDGFVDVDFIAENAGDIPMPAHYLVQIYTQITGWDSIDNNVAGIEGIPTQEDIDYRIQRKETINNSSSGQLDSILSSLKLVKNVRDVYGLDNSTKSVIEKSGIKMDPNSEWFCIIGGDDKEIANIFYTKKSGGSVLMGDVTIDVPIQDTPEVFTAHFARPNQLLLTIDIVLDKNHEYSPTTEATIKQIITDNFVYGKEIRMGREIFASMINSWLLNGGIINIRSVLFNNELNSILPKVNEQAIISAINIIYK